MKYALVLILSFCSLAIFGQHSIYHSNAKILDYLEFESLSRHQITKITEDNSFQVSTIYLNDSYKVDSILIRNSDNQKLIFRIEFLWSKDADYAFTSDLVEWMGQNHADEHLLVKGFSYFKAYKTMRFSGAAQFWIENGTPKIAERYNIVPYINASRKVLNQLIKFKYGYKKQLLSIEEFNLNSKEYNLDNKILDLNLKYPSDIDYQFKYGDFGEMKLKERRDNFGGKQYDVYVYNDELLLRKIVGFANGNVLTNKEEFTYFDGLVKSIKFTFIEDGSTFLTNYRYFNEGGEIMIGKK